MKVLNLYAGIGGNRKLWTDVEVTAVELNLSVAKIYQEFFRDDTVLVRDSMEFIKNNRNDFGFIWGSPPCQKHSRMMKATRHNVADFIDLQLYQLIIFFDNFFDGLWVVENVVPYYSPLIDPSIKIGRHLFWSNFKITHFNEPKMPKFITKDTVAETEEFKKWLGFEYKGNIYLGKNHSPGQVLRNCVHPEIGLHILNCARGVIKSQDITQQSLF